MTTKISLTLIHNHNQSRNEAARAALTQIAEIHQSEFQFRRVEVSYQPPLRRFSVAVCLFRDFYALLHKRAWQRYRNIKPRHLLRDLHGFMRGVIKRYIKNSADHRTRLQRSAAIENVLTQKHVRSWQIFLDSEDDFLACFEDDIIAMPDSPARFLELATYIKNEAADRPLYVDLAGGLPQEALKMHPFLIASENGVRTLTKPATNTACG